MKVSNIRICQKVILFILLLLFIYILYYNICQYIVPRLFLRLQEGMECKNVHINDNATKLENLEKKIQEYSDIFKEMLDNSNKQKKTIQSNKKKIMDLQLKCSKCS